jgi:hypothetical protein
VQAPDTTCLLAPCLADIVPVRRPTVVLVVDEADTTEAGAAAWRAAVGELLSVTRAAAGPLGYEVVVRGTRFMGFAGVGPQLIDRRRAPGIVLAAPGRRIVAYEWSDLPSELGGVLERYLRPVRPLASDARG